MVALTGCAAIVGWSIIASAMLIMDTIGAGSLRDQARREQAMYEERLNALAGERDLRAEETRNAQNRFNLALTEVSKMQSALLASEDRRKELETGIGVIQSTLRRTMSERDTALAEAENLTVALAESTDADKSGAGHAEDMRETVAFLSEALNLTATERDTIAAEAAAAYELAGALDFDRQLSQDRNDRIFGQLEDALTISIEPLDKMFRSAGLNTDTLIEQVRRGYSGQGGPLTPLSVSTKGELTDPETLRANGILDRLDQLNLYRIAAEKTPFSLPLKSSFRFTSGFGARWGRMHNGTDFAASYGTPIYSTADGVVIHAGWMSGYGRVVKIQHEFGIETRYAHMSKIHVTVGQRVSRGDRIGDMGNSGRSTGTHLHYEVRVGGKPVNPMIYIKAARDVF
ncbi:murein DD-endopeptidase MepM/ murein hydrolase activator NlpD [Confluentimicrobium naphthalenivorans]|uniref:Murein DD-endopeptidase MepM/ murein hydrolase activator NlpD n=1 Tax=Actibacterium naphthalenivorans TaxID=1614693 RepID=A0A840CD03_9RHOB|nr:murein DD-endopeptidase MepM/ murein hydrolase activator NlpD [Actibacterium naphthalenivorans]